MGGNVLNSEDILANLDRVQPFFQPIFSADEHRVAGFEILGRYKTETGYQSLGPFFLDSKIPMEYRNEVDNYLLDKALAILSAKEEDFLIFINRDPNLLMIDHGEQFLSIIQTYFKGDAVSRIVLELSDTDYEEILDSLQHVLSYYRTFGMKIALDHNGAETKMDRIAQISPHILKVNLEQLRKTSGEVTQVILFSLSFLARKIGANLLFEHIESQYQLRYAWKNGGRYYQGFLLAKPELKLVDRDILRENFKKECRGFITLEMKKLENVYQLTNKFNEDMKSFMVKYKKTAGYGEWLHTLAEKIESMSFRLYICNEEGFQISPNILKKEGNWIVQETYMGKNWSWRPYFLENIVQMKHEKKGILSDLYSDIESGETIRTFSFPLDHNSYLFIDLSYEYLYENDDLL